jgi:uncharacterized membrane protein YkoI
MKKLFLFMSITAMLMSCDYLEVDDDSNNDPVSNLPASVFDYIDANYPDYNIQSYETDDLCDDVPVYEVELEDGPGPDIDLYFTMDGDFLFVATEISLSDLPGAVLDAIDSEFPGYGIDEEKIEQLDFPDGSVQFELDLYSLTNSDSDLEVLFNADGTIECQDGYVDDDPDSTDTTSSNIPTSVLDFIQQEFDGYQIEGVETDDICDDVPVYEVELEDGPGPDIDLYFDMDWNFLFSATEVSPDDLPMAVTSFLATEFPGYEMDDDKVERWELPDGSIRYQLELESDDDSDIEIVVNEDGSLYCYDD